MLTPCSRVFLKEGKKRIWKEKKENVFSSFLMEGKESIWRDNFSLFSLKSYPPKSGMIWKDNFPLSFLFLPLSFLSFPAFLKLENRALGSTEPIKYDFQAKEKETEDGFAKQIAIAKNCSSIEHNNFKNPKP